MTPENERVCDPSERSSVKTARLSSSSAGFASGPSRSDEFALEVAHGGERLDELEAEDAVLLALDREAGERDDVEIQVRMSAPELHRRAHLDHHGRLDSRSCPLEDHRPAAELELAAAALEHADGADERYHRRLNNVVSSSVW